MCKKLGAVSSLVWANKYVKENLSILRESETQHPTPKSVWIFLLGFFGFIVGFRASTQPTVETQHPTPKSVWIFLLGFLGCIVGFRASTQPTVIAMITIIRSRGVLYAKLKQTEKAKIDLKQAAILFRQQNNMATYEKVMQILQQLGG